MNFFFKIICCIMCLFYENFFMDLLKVKMICKYIVLFKVYLILLFCLVVFMLLWGLLLSMLKDRLFYLFWFDINNVFLLDFKILLMN